MELENFIGHRCLLLQPSKHKQQRYLQRAHCQWEAPKVLNSSVRADVHSSVCRKPPWDLCQSPGEVSKRKPRFITRLMICVLAVRNMGQHAEETRVGRKALPKGKKINTNFCKAAGPFLAQLTGTRHSKQSVFKKALAGGGSSVWSAGRHVSHSPRSWQDPAHSSSPGCGRRDNAARPRSNRSPGRWKRDAGVCFVTALHRRTPRGQRCPCLHIPRSGAAGDPSHRPGHGAHRTALIWDAETKRFPTSTCIVLQNAHPPTNILLLAVIYS